MFGFIFGLLGETIESPITYSERNVSKFVSHVFLVFTIQFMLVVLVLSKAVGGPYRFGSHEWFTEATETVLMGIVIMSVAQAWVRFAFAVLVPFLGSILVGPFFFSHQKIANAVASFRQKYDPAERLAEFCVFVGCYDVVEHSFAI